MSRQNTYRHISKIEEAARIILKYIDDSDYESFKGDLKTQDAVMMRLVSIGELVNRLIDNDPEFINENQQIPWNMIKGMRNKIAHDYFGIDSRVLFETTRISIPQLVELMNELIKTKLSR